jgi:hypothetical protein
MRILITGSVCFCVLWFVAVGDAPVAQSTLVLSEAAVCEGLKDRTPLNPGIAFPVSAGRVYCFTDFTGFSQTTLIYHVWFRRDERKARVKLQIRPPRWSTFSYISLKDSDKGPWRVEITDNEGQVLRTLRFSIID